MTYKIADKNKDKIEQLTKLLDKQCDAVVNGVRYKAIARLSRSQEAWTKPLILRIIEIPKGSKFNKNFNKSFPVHYVETVNIYKRPLQHAAELYGLMRTFEKFIKQKRIEDTEE